MSDFMNWLVGEKHASHDQSSHGRRGGGGGAAGAQADLVNRINATRSRNSPRGKLRASGGGRVMFGKSETGKIVKTLQNMGFSPKKGSNQEGRVFVDWEGPEGVTAEFLGMDNDNFSATVRFKEAAEKHADHDQSSHGRRAGGGSRPGKGLGSGGNMAEVRAAKTGREQRSALFDFDDQDGTFVKLTHKPSGRSANMTVRAARLAIYPLSDMDGPSPFSISSGSSKNALTEDDFGIFSLDSNLAKFKETAVDLIGFVSGEDGPTVADRLKAAGREDLVERLEALKHGGSSHDQSAHGRRGAAASGGKPNKGGDSGFTKGGGGAAEKPKPAPKPKPKAPATLAPKNRQSAMNARDTARYDKGVQKAIADADQTLAVVKKLGQNKNPGWGDYYDLGAYVDMVLPGVTSVMAVDERSAIFPGINFIRDGTPSQLRASYQKNVGALIKGIQAMKKVVTDMGKQRRINYGDMGSLAEMAQGLRYMRLAATGQEDAADAVFESSGWTVGD